MMRTIACLFACVLGAVCPALDLTMVPADHRWVVQIDVAQALQGRIGGFVADLAGKPPLKAKLAAITAMTGFDPLKDCSLITLSGVDAREDQAVLVAAGRFESKRLETLVEANDTHEALAAGGTQVIHRWKDDHGGGVQCAALVGDRLLVAGKNVERIKAVLAVLGGGAKAANAADLLGAEVPTAPAALVVVAASGIADWLGPQAAMLKQAKALFLTVGESGDLLQLRGLLAASDEKAAQDVLNVANGLMAMARLGQGQQQDPTLAGLLNSVRVSCTGATVDMSCSIPVQTLLDKVRIEMQKQGGRRQHQETDEAVKPANTF